VGIFAIPGTAAPDGLTLLADTTLAAPAASIDITGLPNHAFYYVVMQARTDKVAATSGLVLQLNGSAANYAGTYMLFGAAYSRGATATADIGTIPSDGDTAGIFGNVTGVITNSGTQFRTMKFLCTGADVQGSLFNNLWSDTSTITQMTLTCNGDNFNTGTRVKVYGFV